MLRRGFVVVCLALACNSYAASDSADAGEATDAAVTDATVNDTGGGFAAIAIADSSGAVVAMAADDLALYWGAGNDVWRWTPAGGAKRVASTANPVTSIALDPAWVAWMTSAGLHVLSRDVDDAGTVAVVDGGEVTTGMPARDVTVAGGAAYYTNRKSIYQFDLASGAITPCAYPFGPAAPTFDGVDIVLFGSDLVDAATTLYRRPTGSCAPVAMPPGPWTPRALVADSRAQYWIDERGVVELTNNGVDTILDAAQQPTALALKAAALFIATSSRIVTFAVETRAMNDIATAQHGATAIAATFDAVYWATSEDHKVWRASR